MRKSPTETALLFPAILSAVKIRSDLQPQRSSLRSCQLPTGIPESFRFVDSPLCSIQELLGLDTELFGHDVCSDKRSFSHRRQRGEPLPVMPKEYTFRRRVPS